MSLNLHELADRYHYLQVNQRDGQLSSEEEEELSELEEVEDRLGDLQLAADKFELILGSGWVSHCRKVAEEKGFIKEDNPLWDFVDWDGWSEFCFENSQPVMIRGEMYYYYKK